MFDLIVREPFGDYAKGDRITDPDTVASIEAGANVHHVVRVASATAPPPASAPDPAPARPAPAVPAAPLAVDPEPKA